jgi:hypothetical protein
MNNKQQKLINSNYELGGNSLLRQFNHWRRMRLSIMGFYGGGPSLRNLLVMSFYHYLGKPVFRLQYWYLQQFRLKAFVSRVLPKRGGNA